MLWKIKTKEANKELYLYLRALLFISCFSKFSSGMSFSDCFISLHMCMAKFYIAVAKKNIMK